MRWGWGYRVRKRPAGDRLGRTLLATVRTLVFTLSKMGAMEGSEQHTGMH